MSIAFLDDEVETTVEEDVMVMVLESCAVLEYFGSRVGNRGRRPP
jgi:hypothetical protein